MSEKNSPPQTSSVDAFGAVLVGSCLEALKGRGAAQKTVL